MLPPGAGRKPNLRHEVLDRHHDGLLGGFPSSVLVKVKAVTLEFIKYARPLLLCLALSSWQDISCERFVEATLHVHL